MSSARTIAGVMLIPAACLVAALSPMSGQERTKSAPDTAIVEVIAIDGQTHRGSLAEFTDDQIAISQNQPARFPVSDLIRVSFTDRPRETTHTESVIVYFENGDRIALKSATIENESIVGRFLAGGRTIPVGIPLETVRGILLRSSQIAAARRANARELADDRTKSDVVMLANGDRISGELTKLDERKITLISATGETSVDRNKARWIRFNSELISFPIVSEKKMLLTLVGHSRITAAEWQLIDKDRLRIKAAYGGEVELPLSSIIAARFLGGRVQYLSDIEPAELRFEPYLSRQWPLRQDCNVLGDPLSLRGEEYPKGLGMHSGGSVKFALRGEYREFRSLIGIDDSADGQGSARFTVEVDGRRAFESAEVRGSDPAELIGPISLVGANELTLSVEYGEAADIFDHADWTDAMLIR